MRAEHNDMFSINNYNLISFTKSKERKCHIINCEEEGGGGGARRGLVNAAGQVWWGGGGIPKTKKNALSNIKTHLGGIDDRESNFYFQLIFKMCLQHKRHFFSSRAKGPVLEHHEGSICARA